jgi:hypothetical protein
METPLAPMPENLQEHIVEEVKRADLRVFGDSEIFNDFMVFATNDETYTTCIISGKAYGKTYKAVGFAKRRPTDVPDPLRGASIALFRAMRRLKDQLPSSSTAISMS